MSFRQNLRHLKILLNISFVEFKHNYVPIFLDKNTHSFVLKKTKNSIKHFLNSDFISVNPRPTFDNRVGDPSLKFRRTNFNSGKISDPKNPKKQDRPQSRSGINSYLRCKHLYITIFNNEGLNLIVITSS